MPACPAAGANAQIGLPHGSPPPPPLLFFFFFFNPPSIPHASSGSNLSLRLTPQVLPGLMTAVCDPCVRDLGKGEKVQRSAGERADKTPV